MALKFLSEEFFTEGEALVNADPAVQRAAQGLDLSMAIDITGGPDGDFTYAIVFADDRVSVGRGDIGDPDARVRNSYDVATKLARGELGNQMALMTGKVKITGGLSKLIKHQKTLDLVQAILSDIDVDY